MMTTNNVLPIDCTIGKFLLNKNLYAYKENFSVAYQRDFVRKRGGNNDNIRYDKNNTTKRQCRNVKNIERLLRFRFLIQHYYTSPQRLVARFLYNPISYH